MATAEIRGRKYIILTYLHYHRPCVYPRLEIVPSIVIDATATYSYEHPEPGAAL